jgi:integrase
MICLARDKNPTLSGFLESVYVPSRVDISAGAVEQIRYAITAVERWHGSPVKIRQLSEPFVRGFLSAYAKDVSAGTVNSKRGHLLALWQCGWEEGYLPAPPKRTQVRRARATRRVPEAWTADEMSAILAACNATRRPAWWKSILLVAYQTGERRGALLATAPAAVNLDRACIVFTRTKTGRQRWCSLTPDCVAAVRSIYDATAPLVWRYSGTLRRLDDCLAGILDRAGVRHGRPAGGVWHKFRRTSGSLVEQAGGDGARHIGVTRAVFEMHYKDPRLFASSVNLLPAVVG